MTNVLTDWLLIIIIPPFQSVHRVIKAPWMKEEEENVNKLAVWGGKKANPLTVEQSLVTIRHHDAVQLLPAHWTREWHHWTCNASFVHGVACDAFYFHECSCEKHKSVWTESACDWKHCLGRRSDWNGDKKYFCFKTVQFIKKNRIKHAESFCILGLNLQTSS